MNTTTENTTEPTYWLFTNPDDNLTPNYQIAYKGTLEEIQHLIGYQETQEYLTLTPTHLRKNNKNNPWMRATLTPRRKHPTPVRYRQAAAQTPRRARWRIR